MQGNNTIGQKLLTAVATFEVALGSKCKVNRPYPSDIRSLAEYNAIDGQQAVVVAMSSDEGDNTVDIVMETGKWKGRRLNGVDAIHLHFLESFCRTKAAVEEGVAC